MTKIHFNRNDTHSIGVELELGIVDAQSMALASRSDALLESLPEPIAPFCKHELVQSCVEVISDVCHDVAEVRTDLAGKLTHLQSAAAEHELRLWWGGTHPFSLWQDQKTTPDPRYHNLVEMLQEMARRLVTFGLHVHVGVDSGDKAVMICDRIMQHLPLFLSLSASSPFWQNHDTGLHSYRSKLMDGLPTAGLPSLMRNWSEYVWIVSHMIDTGFISSIREIWWDVRPHHNFGTVELRMCDMPGNLDHACGLTALAQCLVKSLNDEIEEGTYQFDCHPMMVRQNKWRASRFGLDAPLVDAVDYRVRDARTMITEMVDRLADIAQELDCADELHFVREMASSPTWATRQREIFEQTGGPIEVVRQLSHGHP